MDVSRTEPDGWSEQGINLNTLLALLIMCTLLICSVHSAQSRLSEAKCVCARTRASMNVDVGKCVRRQGDQHASCRLHRLPRSFTSTRGAPLVCDLLAALPRALLYLILQIPPFAM